MNGTEHRLDVTRDVDVALATQQARKSAASCGFDATQQTLLGTCASELARNILKYAGQGTVIIRHLEEEGRAGLEIIACDEGPGIEDIESALQDHVSTGKTLGLGLPGVKRMMDELRVESEIGRGTTVTARKWK